MASPLIRYKVELLLGGVWTDITTYVRHSVRIKVERGTTDAAPKATPATASLRLDNRDDRFNPFNPTSPYYGKLIRNTQIRITCVGVVGDTSRFWGEVFAFEPRWTEGRHESYVDIKPSGALRRIVKKGTAPRSYYRSWINTHTLNPRPKYYYPMEDGSDAGTAQAEIGQGSAVIELADPRFPVPNNGNIFGAAKFNDWIPNGAALPNLWQFRFPCDMRGSTSPSWEMTCLLTFPTNETTAVIVIYTDVGYYYITLYNTFPDWTEGNLVILDPNGGSAQALGCIGNLRDVGPIWFTFRASFSGSVISHYAAIEPVAESGSVASVLGMGSFARASHLYPREMTIAVSNNTASPTTNVQNYLGVKDVSMSDASAGSAGLSLSYAAAKGNPGEWTFDRFAAMCAEQGINANPSGNGSVQMGRRYIQSFESHLEEILASSQHSGIVESRGANELLLLGTGTYRGNIDYTELVPKLEPVVDDQMTANIVQYSNSHGVQATLTKSTGPMSTVDIGPFPDKIEANNWTTSQGLALAAKRLVDGTWQGPRFRSFTVSARAKPGEYSKYRSIDVGDYFGLTGMASAGYPDVLYWKVLHVEESLAHEDHVFTYTAKPGETDLFAWQIGTSRIDVADSTVAVGGSGGTIDVNVPLAKWLSGSAPFDIMVSGERMTVTAVATLTSTTQRLTVTRSVNGVVKSTPVGATVHVFPPYFIKAV